MRKAKNNGFSLTEVMVSLSLFAMVMGSGMSFYFNSQEIQGKAMHKKIVTELINSKLEELKELDYDTDPLLSPGAHISLLDVEGLPPAQQEIFVTDKDDPAGGATDDYKEVRVSVAWNDSGKNMAYDFVTYIAP